MSLGINDLGQTASIGKPTGPKRLVYILLKSMIKFRRNICVAVTPRCDFFQAYGRATFFTVVSAVPAKN